jgi:uncharacterized UPF0160 family protein
VIYHCISRFVDLRFVFGKRECDAFRIFMRMHENFSGRRLSSYCLMYNHFHPLLQRHSGLYSEAVVADVAVELVEARTVAAGETGQNGDAAGRCMTAIHSRFTCRMHDLSKFMKTLLQRFMRWQNKRAKRSGNLREETFKSVVVVDGMASRTMAAYIGLNPVRAGMG